MNTYEFDPPPPGDVMPFGCLPRTDRCGDVFPVLEDSDVVPLIPRDKWATIIPQVTGLEPMVRKIKNQKQEGTCASNATCQAAEIVWNVTFGPRAWVELSPIAIYRWIAPGPDTGSVISDNLVQLRKVGALPVDNFTNRQNLAAGGLNSKHVLQPTGYSQPFPEGWKETAALFQGLEAFDIRTIDGFVSASIAGFPIVAGRQAHAICYVRPVYVNGVLRLKYANSWGAWGEDGYGYDPPELLERSLESYGAFALRSLRLRPEILKFVEAMYRVAS